MRCGHLVVATRLLYHMREKKMKRLVQTHAWLVITVLAVIVVGCDQSYPAIGSITEDDLLHDVTALAHDDFEGREAGTIA